jgi:1A family penicillin-binding protein
MEQRPDGPISAGERIRLLLQRVRARAGRVGAALLLRLEPLPGRLARGGQRAGAAAVSWLRGVLDGARPRLRGLRDGARSRLREVRDRADPRLRGLRDGARPWLSGLRDRTLRQLGGLIATAHPRLRRFAAGMARRPELAAVPLFVAFVIGLTLYSNCGTGGCPDVRQLTAYQPGGAPVLLDRYGEKFADLAPYERIIVSLDSLPSHVPNAFIAVEDRRFWEHQGIDWRRVPGAAVANLRARGVSQGSSTIPMQLARNVFPRELPGSDRTLKRKLQEVRVAQLLELTFEKREILEMYLNHIYFGGGAYGIEAAARLYFGKAAEDLTLAEAATLAALPKAPTHYDPRREPEQSRARRDLVLTLMERHRLVGFEEADAARSTDLAVRADGERDRSGIPLGPSFVDVVREAMEDRFGENLYRSRLRIHTTLDPVAQRAAEQEIEAQLASLRGRVRAGEGELQGAVVIVEAATGDVLALVGGADPTLSRYDRARHARRQVGSAFKPFVFAAALQDGIPTSQIIMDSPLRMHLSRNDVWEPSNYDGRFEGQVSLRHALVRSRNIPTIKLAATVGIGDVARTAREAGVGALMDETPALALGTVATSPLELTLAYVPFATLGQTTAPRYVLRVEDEDGRLLWEQDQAPSRQALDPAVAYIITDILRDAVDRGTGGGVRAAGYRGLVAGKTGTTNNSTDVWFVGYTPELVGTVWIGYDRPTSLGRTATGGGMAAPVWGRIMRQVHAERPAAAEWPRPPGVVARRIDPGTGLVLGDGCAPRYGPASTEIFMEKHIPATVCPYRDYWRDLWDRMGGRDARVEQDRRGYAPRPQARGRGPIGREVPGRGRSPRRN